MNQIFVVRLALVCLCASSGSQTRQTDLDTRRQVPALRHAGTSAWRA
jgi:hypothetical protein